MLVKVIPRTTFLLRSGAVTSDEIMAVALPAMQELSAEAERHGLHKAGPLQLLFPDERGSGHDPFPIEVALPVREPATTPASGFQLRTAPPFRCATLQYQCSIRSIAAAWQTLFEDLQQAGLRRTGTLREVYLHFVDGRSLDNLFELQAGLQ